jgi:mannose-6-phosphate isomerase-like protein (cupin superfamily)
MHQNGKSYTVAQLGRLKDWGHHSFTHSALPLPVPGKGFVKDVLSLSAMEVSVNNVPAGAAIPFYHRHRANEELYVFLSGHGEMQVDGDMIAVTEGSAVRVAPKGKRAWRNTGEDALVFLVIQARAGSLAHGDISDGEIIPGEVVWGTLEG